MSKKIAIASGKGGVGKSMLTSALAVLFSQEKKVVAVDCDVDAPNLAIWLNQNNDWDDIKKISTSSKAVVDYDKCDGCGICAEKCRFNAIKMVDNKPVINPFLCEGCGACEILCPKKAIHLEPVKNGEIRFKNVSSSFDLVSGQLYPGETGSGKIVSEIKKEAEDIEHELMVIDSSPGTGCPVIAALRDVDFVLLVTEPTLSGFSDLKRVIEVIDHFNISFSVVVNKWEVNEEKSKEIKEWAGDKFAGKISYDQKIFNAVANLTPILETELKAKKEVKEIFNRIKNKVL
jgi:MinD superfamily P-loop ATPase